MPSTARLTPSCVRKCVCNCSISSRAISQSVGRAWVERIAQSVAEQIDSQHGDGQERGGEENDKGLHLPECAALGHDVAPGWRNRRRSSVDERQDRLDDHGAGADWALLPLFRLVGVPCIAAFRRVKSLLCHHSDRPKLANRSAGYFAGATSLTGVPSALVFSPGLLASFRSRSISPARRSCMTRVSSAFFRSSKIL